MRRHEMGPYYRDLVLAKSGHWASKPRNYSSSSTQSTSPRKLTVMSFDYAVLIDPGQGQILVALFAKDCK